MKIFNAVAVLALGLAGCKEKSIIREEVEQGLRQANAPSSVVSAFNDALDAKVQEVREHAKYASTKAAVRAKMGELKTADFDSQFPDASRADKAKAKAYFDRLRKLKTVDFDDLAAVSRMGTALGRAAGVTPEQFQEAFGMLRAHGMTEAEIADLVELMGVHA